MLTYRCRQILKIIVGAKRPLRVAELADELQVSARAVKYDLETIRLWLQKENIQGVCLESKPHKGVWLEGDTDKVHQLVCEVARAEPNILLNQEERIKYIMITLMLATDYTTIRKIMDKTGVSRNTIVNDLKKAEQLLKYWNVELVGKAHHGMLVKADEADLRASLEYLIQSYFSSNDMAYLMQSFSLNRELPVEIGQVMERYLLGYWEIHAIHQTVRSIIRQGGGEKYLLTERAILGLFIRFCVVIQRVKSGCYLLSCNENMQKIEENSMCCLLRQECSRLGDSLGFAIPEKDVCYIWLQLKSSLNQSVPESDIHGQPLIMTTITSEIIAGVSALAQIPFYEETELFDSLLAHLNDRLAKYQQRVLDPNPMMTEVIRNYSKMFGYVKEVCLKTLSSFHIFLSDEDLAYIVLHFQAALEQKFSNYKYKALVVCGTGRGNARLLKVRLENSIKSLHVIACCSIVEIDRFLENTPVDLVISVLPLDIQQQTVIIKALPTEADIQAIYTALENIKPLNAGALNCENKRNTHFLEALTMMKASISQHDLPFVENMSREIINQGIQIAALLVMEFKQQLTEQTAFGLTVHILLMVNRLAFGAAYENADTETMLENERLAILRQQIIAILDENYPGIPEGEIGAILRYFL